MIGHDESAVVKLSGFFLLLLWFTMYACMTLHKKTAFAILMALWFRIGLRMEGNTLNTTSYFKWQTTFRDFGFGKWFERILTVPLFCNKVGGVVEGNIISDLPISALLVPLGHMKMSYDASSRPSTPQASVPVDFSLPASSVSCLDSSAAHHRIAVKANARAKRKPASVRLFTLTIHALSLFMVPYHFRPASC